MATGTTINTFIAAIVDVSNSDLLTLCQHIKANALYAMTQDESVVTVKWRDREFEFPNPLNVIKAMDEQIARLQATTGNTRNYARMRRG